MKVFCDLVLLLVIAGAVKASVIINVVDDEPLFKLLHHEPKVTYSLDDCNLRACDQLCRSLGFPGGACVGDKCKCDNFEPVTVDGKSLNNLLHRDVGTKTILPLDDCNYQACDQLCRRLGFPSGACVGDKCECDNFKKDKDPEVFAKKTDEKKRSNVANKIPTSLKGLLRKTADQVEICDDTICSLSCPSGGFCIAGYCLCF